MARTILPWHAAALVSAVLSAAPAWGESLGNLGLPHGVTLRGPHPVAELVFPLPGRVTDADLALDLYPSVALDPQSSLTISVEGEPLATIGTREGSRLVHIPIPRRLAQGDTLRVRVAADHAIRRGEACPDVENPALWTQLGAASSLTASGEGEGGIGTVWRMLAGDVPIAMPAQPTLEDVRTALILATALAQRGARPSVVGADDPSALLRVSRATPALAVEWRPDPLAAPAGAGSRPLRPARLTVATPEAARALVAAPQLLRGALSSTATVDANEAARPPVPSAVTLAGMGVHPVPAERAGGNETAFEIGFDRLAAGTHPVALELFGQGASALPDEGVLVTVSVGGQLVWTRTFQGAAGLEGVRVALPAELVRHRMIVTVRAARIGRRAGCPADAALPFDLRDSSRVVLAPGAVQPVDFASLAMASDRNALVRLDSPPATAAGAVPLLARLLAAAGARPAAIDVVGHENPLDRPFIVVAELPPYDIAQGAPIRPDLGRVVLQRPRDNVVVVLTDTGRVTTVQLAQAGMVPGVWVSPGAASTLAAAPSLSTGDVAILDGASPEPIVFDTRVPGTVVESAPPPSSGVIAYGWAAGVLAFIAVIAVFGWRTRGRIARLLAPGLTGRTRRHQAPPAGAADPPSGASGLPDGRTQHRSQIIE